MSPRATTLTIPVALPALCWRELRDEFDAVTQELARDGIQFKSRTIPALFEHIVCDIGGGGPLNGRVIRVSPAGFFLKVLTKVRHIRLLVGKRVAIAREQKPKSYPWRDERIQAENISLNLTLQSGSQIPATLMNVSASGAALHVAEPLQVGELVMIGSSGARVVRIFDGGVGVVFLRRLNMPQIDTSLERSGALAYNKRNITLL